MCILHNKNPEKEQGVAYKEWGLEAAQIKNTEETLGVIEPSYWDLIQKLLEDPEYKKWDLHL